MIIEPMKRKIGLIVGSITPLLYAAAAFASAPTATPPVAAGGQNIGPCANPASDIVKTLCAGKDLGQVIGFVVTIAFIIAVLIALAFLILGGIKWITSGGDKGGVEGARNQIIAAIIGLIIVFLAFFILNLVLGLFGLSLFSLTLPKFPGGTTTP